MGGLDENVELSKETFEELLDKIDLGLRALPATAQVIFCSFIAVLRPRKLWQVSRLHLRLSYSKRSVQMAVGEC